MKTNEKIVIEASYERILCRRFSAAGCEPAALGSALLRRQARRKGQVAAKGDDALPWELSPADRLVAGLRKNKMSVRTAAKIRQKIHAMYGAGKAKTFATLTMIAECDDATAVRCLQRFLHQLRKRWKCAFGYLWVVERQESGRPHFHVVLDRAVNVQALNKLWALVQVNQGLVYQVTELRRKKKHRQKITDALGELYAYTRADEDANSDYEYYVLREPVQVNPVRMNDKELAFWLNPFQVTPIHSTRRLATYLAAYVSKSVGAEFSCRIWHCAVRVSHLFTRVLTTSSHLEDALKWLPGLNVHVCTKDVYKGKKLIHAAGELLPPKTLITAHVGIVWVRNMAWNASYLTELGLLNREVWEGVFVLSWLTFFTYEAFARRCLTEDFYSWQLARGETQVLIDLKERVRMLDPKFQRVGEVAEWRKMMGISDECVFVIDPVLLVEDDEDDVIPPGTQLLLFD